MIANKQQELGYINLIINTDLGKIDYTSYGCKSSTTQIVDYPAINRVLFAECGTQRLTMHYLMLPL